MKINAILKLRHEKLYDLSILLVPLLFLLDICFLGTESIAHLKKKKLYVNQSAYNLNYTVSLKYCI